MEKTIYIVIGCDTDPDRSYFLKDIPTDRLSWRGMLEGIPLAKDRLQNLTDGSGRAPVFTWLLRADHQIRELCGAFNFVLTKHVDFLIELEKSGDELGWHPHFWDYDYDRGTWFQNCQDVDWQIEMLEKAHAAYREILPDRAKSVRMGWTYHNNRTYSTLERLGAEVEISAIPGLKIVPKADSGRTSNFFDWYVSPDRPYYPSTTDIRRPAAKGEDSHTLLEAPIFVSKSLFWGALSGLVLARKMRDLRQVGYALSHPTFLATITSRPSLFRPMLSELRKKVRMHGKVIFVTLLHPDELTDNIHPVYCLENMEQNLKSILNLAEDESAETRFIPACRIKNYI